MKLPAVVIIWLTAVPEAMAKTVVLNVGGVHHEVARSTLMQHPNTMLAVLVSERWNADSEKREPIFVDRDGERFRFVLDFYRNGKAVVPASLLGSVAKDFEFFGLPQNALAKDRIEGGEAAEELAYLKRKHAYLGLLVYIMETAVAKGVTEIRLKDEELLREFKLGLEAFNKNEFILVAKQENVILDAVTDKHNVHTIAMRSKKRSTTSSTIVGRCR